MKSYCLNLQNVIQVLTTIFGTISCTVMFFHLKYSVHFPNVRKLQQGNSFLGTCKLFILINRPYGYTK